MINKLHEHILEELKINAKSDTKFIFASIGLNFITLAVNSSIAGTEFTSIITMILFAVLTIGVCIVAEIGLIRGQQASKKLIDGLISIYEDNGVAKYYDKSLLDHYKLRYNLFILVVLLTGIVSVIVPFIHIN